MVICGGRVYQSDKQSEKGYRRRILRSHLNSGSAAGAVGFSEPKKLLINPANAVYMV
jgi:hypothetical protein